MPFQEKVASLGRRAVSLELDVRSEDSIRTMVSDAAQAYPRLDILVNNAGCNVRKKAVDVTWDDWNLILDTNLRGAFSSPSQSQRNDSARPRTNHQHRIGHVGHGLRRLGPYGASRGGIRQLTMSLADDWGPYGITVNCLAPGWFKTDQNSVMYEDAEWVAYLVDRTPVRRPGKPSDLEGPVGFLASDASEYVTGRHCWGMEVFQLAPSARCRRPNRAGRFRDDGRRPSPLNTNTAPRAVRLKVRIVSPRRRRSGPRRASARSRARAIRSSTTNRSRTRRAP